MAALNPLRQLQDLDRSSPQFHDQLSNLLRGEEYRKSVLNLQGDSLTLLVEYLDEVSLKVTLVMICTQLRFQALAATSVPTSRMFQGCLRELTEICGARSILPKSCTLPGPLLDVYLPPVAIGRAIRGIFDGSIVWVKEIKTHIGGNPQGVKQVC